MKLERSALFLGVIAFCMGGIVAFVAMTLSNRTRPAPIAILPPEPTPTVEPTATPGPLLVDVDGAVVVPAVYTLPPGSRVSDAVEMAGGFAEGADTAVVNLAQPLQDGMQVFVPEEGMETAVVEPVTRSDSAAIDLGAGGEQINLNLATVEALDGLPGIGPSTAQKIIDYREQNGPFTAVEQLMEVSGIGEAKFEQVKPFIMVP